MKRVIFLSVLIIFLIIDVNAQNRDSSKVTLTDSFPYFNPNLVSKKGFLKSPINSPNYLPNKNTFPFTPSKSNFETSSYSKPRYNSTKWYDGLGGMILSTIINSNQQMPRKK